MQAKLAALVEQIDPTAKLQKSWPLRGGVSAQVTALEIVRADGQVQRWVVRQHGTADRQRNPQIAADEFKLLQMVAAAGVVVPQPIYVELTGEILGIPALVVEFVDGTSEFTPRDIDHFTYQLALQLHKIHAIHPAHVALDFLPKQRYSLPPRPAQLDETLSEGRIRHALAGWDPRHHANPPTLLHGDYWPGNILWQNGTLAAVIDWEDAQFGDPLADVANCRFELAWTVSPEAMARFTHHYKALSNSALATLDFTNLPYWDLRAALRPAGKLSSWGLDAETEQRMRTAHHAFSEEALQHCG
ncbi:MAG: phosphotransferase [Caldilineaceae bacterium]